MTHREVRPDPALSHYLQGRPERERRNQECRRGREHGEPEERAAAGFDARAPSHVAW